MLGLAKNQATPMPPTAAFSISQGDLSRHPLPRKLIFGIVRFVHMPACSSTRAGSPSSLGYKMPVAYAGTLTAPNGVTSVEALTAAG